MNKLYPKDYFCEKYGCYCNNVTDITKYLPDSNCNGDCLNCEHSIKGETARNIATRAAREIWGDNDRPPNSFEFFINNMTKRIGGALGIPQEILAKEFKENPYLCPPKCKHLNITEEEQNQSSGKPSHKCKKYNKMLYHHGRHPYLIRCDECLYL